MSKILSIAEAGDPFLREVAKPVRLEEIDSNYIQGLIGDMLATIESQEVAVGLAAPQVFELVRIIIIASKPTTAYPDAKKIDPIVMINPETLSSTQFGFVDGWEGCASVPGIKAKVKRNIGVEVKYLDKNGTSQQTELNGFIARIFQHENDHLNGILFLERADLKTLCTEANYQELMLRSG